MRTPHGGSGRHHRSDVTIVTVPQSPLGGSLPGVIPRILLLVVALVLAGCTAASEETTTTTTTIAETSTTATDSTSSSSTSSTVEVVDETPMVIPGIEDLPEDLQAEIIGLVALTEELRGLEFLEAPTITVVSQAELAERVRENIQEVAEDVPSDESVLKLLGLLDPEVDLLQLYTDLYGEQVGGYYDPEVGELVVPASADGFSTLQRATLIHELTHAVTDQRFGSGDRYEALIDAEDFDEAVAFLSVMEGDATLTEILYIQQLSQREAQELLAETFERDSSTFDSAPQFLQNSLIFPYTGGLGFVQRLYELGGFDEVNRAYVEPPLSSEQILHPRDYQSDEPVAVRSFEPEIDGYEVTFRSVWGEVGFGLMLEQVIGDDGAADGWGGDEYIQWFDGTESALLIDYLGDTAKDAEELAQDLIEFAVTGMAVGEPVPVGVGVEMVDEDFAYVALLDDRVIFVAAGDVAVGRAMVEALPTS